MTVARESPDFMASTYRWLPAVTLQQTALQQCDSAQDGRSRLVTRSIRTQIIK